MQGVLINMNNITGNILGTYDTLSMQWENVYNGLYSKVATADLDGNDTLEVVIGNVRGGFGIYSLVKPEEPDTNNDTTIVNIMNISSINTTVNLFPNPAKDILNISFEQMPNHPVDFRIYNPLGQLLIENQANLSDRLFSMNVQNLSQGIYILEVHSRDHKEFIKFNIQH